MDLKKIIVISSGLHGMTNSCVAFSKRLVKEGHDCTLMCSRDLSIRCEREGIEFVKIKEVDFDYFPKLQTSPILTLFNKKSIYDTYIEKTAGLHFIDLITQIEADIVLIDMEMHEHIISLHQNKISFCLLSQWFSIWPGINFPPPNSLTIPSATTPEYIENQWNIEKNKRTPTTKAKLSDLIKPNRKSAIQYLLEKVSFPKDNWTGNLWPTPLVYKNIPTLSFTVEDFDFAGSLDSHLSYIGPQVDLNRYEELDEDDDMKIKHIHRSKENKIIVLLTKSSMTNVASVLYNGILKYLKSRSDCLIVMNTDDNNEEMANTVQFDWLPQIEILKMADVCINHGGIHTIHECIYTDTPMMIYPGGKHDQNGCLARMKNLNIENVLTIKHIDTDQISIFLDKCKKNDFISNYQNKKESIRKYEQTPLKENIYKAIAS